MNPANGRFYSLLAASSWTDAEAAAASRGGHLVTVRSQAEYDWITNSFSMAGGVPRNLWIGLYDPDPLVDATDPVARRAEFVWVSGEPVTFERWNDEEPNNRWEGDHESYGHVWQPGLGVSFTWNDLPNDPWPFYSVHGVVEEPLLEVQFPPPTTATCPFTMPEFTGRPVVLRACGDLASVVVTFEDQREPFGGVIQRRWTVEDRCGQTASFDQFIQELTVGPVMEPPQLLEGGLIARFRVDAPGFMFALWSLNGEPLSAGEEGVTFADNDRTLTLDFTKFRGGTFGEGAGQGGVSYNITAVVSTGCTSGSPGTGAHAPPVFSLSRGLLLNESNVQSTIAQTELTLPCGTFRANSQAFRLRAQDTATALLKLDVNGTSPRVTIRTGDLLGTPTEVACGTDTLIFPTEQGRVYFGWVDSADAYNLRWQLVGTPILTGLTDQNLMPGILLAPLDFTITDPDTPVSDLRISVESSNAELIDPALGIAIAGTEQQRRLFLSPTPGKSGSSTITVRVTDVEGAYAVASFSVTVPGEAPAARLRLELRSDPFGTSVYLDDELPGRRWYLEDSINLQSWNRLTELMSDVSGRARFDPPTSSPGSYRFFRLEPAPP